MNDRHTADSITSDALDALYDEIDRLRAGEEDGYDPLAVPTPGQWIHQFNQATAEKRLAVVGRLIDAAERVWACTMNQHEERIHDGRHAEMALNEVRQVIADMAAQGALQWAGWLRDAMKRGPKHCLLCATEAKPESDAVDQAEADPDGMRAQYAALAFNAVLPALKAHDRWLPLSVRRAVADAVLAVRDEQLEELADRHRRLGIELAHWQTVITQELRTEREQLLAAAGRVRALHHDWQNDPGHCAHCTGPYGNLVRFPCPTIRALDEEQPHV